MTGKLNISELVSRAQKGDRECLGILSARVRRRIFVYLYRMTLDYHLAEDLVQETVLYMIEALPRLQATNNSSLWAWIYRSAWGIYRHYLRPQGHQRIVKNTLVDHEALLQLTADAEDDALEHAERAELCDAICRSLGKMKARQRNVLVLRCFERFSYAQIATVMGCSEIRARVLFFHAKRVLKHKLHNHGFGRRYFLTGLSLFGMITAAHTKSASAALTVTSSIVKTHTIASVLGAIAAESELVKAAMITIAIVAGMICIYTSDADVPTKSTSGITIAGAGDTLLIPKQIDYLETTDLLSHSIMSFTLPDPCDVDPNKPRDNSFTESGEQTQPSGEAQETISDDQPINSNDLYNH